MKIKSKCFAFPAVICPLLFLILNGCHLFYSHKGVSTTKWNYKKRSDVICDSVLKILKKAQRVEGEYIGIIHSKSKTYEAAKTLWYVSDIKELTKLTSHKNPLVRCYAFLGLIDKKEDKIKVRAIADKHKKDKEIISTQHGCIGMKFAVGYFMQMNTGSYCLDPKFKQELDSLYIYSGK